MNKMTNNSFAAIVLFAAMIFSTNASAAIGGNWVYLDPVAGPIGMVDGDVIPVDIDNDGKAESFGLSPNASVFSSKSAKASTPGRILCLTLQASGQGGVCFPTGGTSGTRVTGGFRIELPNNPEIGALGQVTQFTSNLRATGVPPYWTNYRAAALVGTYRFESLMGGGCRETATLGGATTFAGIEQVPALANTPGCNFAGHPEWTAIAIDLATGNFCPNTLTYSVGCPGGGTTTGWDPTGPNGGGGVNIVTDGIFANGFE